MADAILMAGGTGGVSSDDVTASKAQVLKGYKTVTRDSDDEVVEGTFPVTSDTDTRLELWYYNAHGEDCYVTRIPEGAYIRYYNPDGTQSWEPWIRISRQLIKNAINYRPEATLENTNTCGEQGKIQVVDTSHDSYRKTRTAEYGLDKSRNAFYMHLPQRNAYYMRGDNTPHVEIDANGLGDALPSDIVSTKFATSKEGVAMRGLLQYRGNGGKPNGVVCPEMWYYNVEDSYVARFDSGAYYNSGNFKPYVSIPVSLVKQAVNYHPESTLDNVITCNERGKVPVIDTKVNNYTVNQAKNFGIDGNRGKLYMELGYGNAYYCRDDNSPHVEVDAARLGTAGADSVLSGQTASSQYGIKFSGNIQRWIATHGDVIIANSSHSGQGFAYDLPGVGRGIVVGIKNGAFIQGANYAFLPSPNLQHWNIRKDVNINGTIGTMEDYGAGGVPFNGATFDNRLISGVANKGFILEHIPRFLNFKNIGYGYAGIQDGGIKLLNGYGGNTHIKSAPDVGCVLSKSINLTPFRYIKVGFKFLIFRGDGTASQPARISLEAGVAPVGNAGGESYSNESHTVLKDIGQRSKSVSHVMTSTRTNAGDISDKSQQFMTLDVTDRTGHHFMYFMLGNIVHEYSQGSVYAVAIVNHIEFIN
nr:MAG TPA: hypothetical protein [Caudoviricetes sp.]